MSKQQGHDHLLAEFSVLVKQLAQDVSVQAIKPELDKAAAALQENIELKTALADFQGVLEGAVNSQMALKASTQKLSRQFEELSRQLAKQHENQLEVNTKYKNITVAVSAVVIVMLFSLIIKIFIKGI